MIGLIDLWFDLTLTVHNKGKIYLLRFRPEPGGKMGFNKIAMCVVIFLIGLGLSVAFFALELTWRK
jgi:hypothetical protein